MTSININKEKFGQLIHKEKLVLVDFWAPSCGYCRRIGSAYEKISEEYSDILIAGKVNIDEEPQIAEAEKISGQLDEIKRKIEDAKNSKKLLEQNELSDKIKLKDFLGIQKFDTEKLREIIKVIRVHSQDEIEIEWNFDDIFSEQR